jgi:hypothetical protein
LAGWVTSRPLASLLRLLSGLGSFIPLLRLHQLGRTKAKNRSSIASLSSTEGTHTHRIVNATDIAGYPTPSLPKWRLIFSLPCSRPATLFRLPGLVVLSYWLTPSSPPSVLPQKPLPVSTHLSTAPHPARVLHSCHLIIPDMVVYQKRKIG